MEDTCITQDQEKPFWSTVLHDFETVEPENDIVGSPTGPKGDH